jgi:surfeit locus 1 family protein
MKAYRWLRWLTFVAIPVVALGMLALGVWQLSRLQERRAQNARVEARLVEAPRPLDSLDLAGDLAQFEYRPVVARGTFDFAQEVVWRTQAYQGSPGVHVITPLRLAGSEQAVLVDRGWIPALEAERASRAAYQRPAGEVEIRGILRVPGQRRWSFEPQDIIPAGETRLDGWFFLNIARLQTQIGYPLYPIMLQQAPDTAEMALPLATYDLQLDDGSHLSYAVQWFAFAAIALVGPLVYWHRHRHR